MPGVNREALQQWQNLLPTPLKTSGNSIFSFFFTKVFKKNFDQNLTENLSVDESQPYAELWMGTHPKAPAVVASTGERLSDFIGAKADQLGEVITSQFGQNLPFLLKILSVNQALSIQGKNEQCSCWTYLVSSICINLDPLKT